MSTDVLLSSPSGCNFTMNPTNLHSMNLQSGSSIETGLTVSELQSWHQNQSQTLTWIFFKFNISVTGHKLNQYVYILSEMKYLASITIVW